MATFRRTIEPQRPVPTRAARHLDLLTDDNLAANETVTFLIQRAPYPELIEPTQHLEFLHVR